MKNLLFIISLFLLISCKNKDPYSEGMHWDYSIIHENGFVYKSFGSNKGTIQVLNSDGTPLKVGKKIY